MKKILIVEDEIFVAEALKEKLKLVGEYEVDIATDGRSGIEKITTMQPDLILLDILMPKMDGIEMMRELKDKKLDNQPVVVLTNFSDSEKEEELIGLGAKKVLVKADLALEDVVEVTSEYLS